MSASVALLASGCVDSRLAPAPDSDPCTSSWQAIQKNIFEGRGCTAKSCHGASKQSGGLDLRADAAYEALIFQAAEAGGPSSLYRVHPGEEDLSMLYLKVAAATNGDQLPSGAGAPMPVGQNSLSEDELAALRLWIRAGAPKDGVVEGTQSLLACELPEQADPNRAPAPPVPDENEGFQHAAGSWRVAAGSEDEVCFATYYDLSESAPAWARYTCELLGVEQECVAYNRRELSQDAQSHHSIISIYAGEASPTDPAWGDWRCSGGELAGDRCDPTSRSDCGAEGVCQTKPVSALTCRALGPADQDTHSINAGGAQTPVQQDVFPKGVYAEVPVKGVVLWNSHGFNLTTQATDLFQYNTFWYAPADERKHKMQRLFDRSHIFAMQVPPYTQREYCNTFTLPQHARLAFLGSHVHKRGVLWRTWLPPNDPGCTPSNDCKPNRAEPVYESKIYNDPLMLNFAMPLAFDAAEPEARTLKYCAVFDNGEQFPELLKLRTDLPDGASACSAAQTFCVGGDRQGSPCQGDDKNCGEGGACDACTVVGGVTTEDEMFILTGGFYVDAPDAE